MANKRLEKAGKEATWPHLQVWRVPMVRDILSRSRRPRALIDWRNRRILFFPYGNNVDHASLYLEHAWEGDPPENWYACVQFSLVLWNPKDPSIYVSHGEGSLDQESNNYRNEANYYL